MCVRSQIMSASFLDAMITRAEDQMAFEKARKYEEEYGEPWPDEEDRDCEHFFAGAPLNLLFSALKSAPVLSSRCMGEGHFLTPSPPMMLAGPRVNDLQQLPPASCSCSTSCRHSSCHILLRQVRGTTQQEQSEMAGIIVNQHLPEQPEMAGMMMVHDLPANYLGDVCPAPPRPRPPPRNEQRPPPRNEQQTTHYLGDVCPAPPRLRPPPRSERNRWATGVPPTVT
jgi:hypothetical protein